MTYTLTGDLKHSNLQEQAVSGLATETSDEKKKIVIVGSGWAAISFIKALPFKMG